MEAVAVKVGEWFVGYIVIRGVVAPFFTKLFKKYLLDPIIKWFKDHFVRSERELAIWLHHQNRMANKGHAHKKAAACSDGLCVELK